MKITISETFCPFEVGAIKRKINKAKGTYKKRTYKLRIQEALNQ